MAKANKVLVLGLDGMEPDTTRRMVDAGKMPNVKKLLERGAARKDLELLGAMPTITPAQWTTLACGCYPGTHGVTDFWNQAPDAIDTIIYGLDSRLCQAEQLWNVTAEAGKKTLVWQWPGSSWPPSSESENLYVVDGTQPASVNYSIANIDIEKYVVASKDFTENNFIDHIGSKNLGDAATDCVIDKLDLEEKDEDEDKYADFKFNADNKQEFLLNRYKMKRIKNVDFHPITNDGGKLAKVPFDKIESAITAPTNWAFAIPEGALEFAIYTAGGQLRRPCLILKNAQGIYDTVVIYKSKKDNVPLCTLRGDEIATDVVDDCLDNGQKTLATRWYKLLELSEDGSHLKLWISAAMDITNDSLWHPRRLFQVVTENMGYPQPTSIIGGSSKMLIEKCMLAQWEATANWQSGALNHLIEQEQIEIIFSHFHNIDLLSHMVVKFLKDKGHSKLSEADYAEIMENIYQQTDRYIGRFLHLLDEGWTLFIVSDHAAVCPEHEPVMMGDMVGVNVRVMEELGFTALKKDASGQELREIDWAHTKAIAQRGNHIYINLKGRDAHGIVEPTDQYEVEEEIMTALYGYKDKVTGKRVIALALRNKDAILLGMGGPESGDILYWMAEGYNYDHCDSLSTTYGYGGTSVSPIFIAAGTGLKKGYETTRIIREVDLTPTMAVLGGVRMPNECEGAPIYQILE